MIFLTENMNIRLYNDKTRTSLSVYTRIEACLTILLERTVGENSFFFSYPLSEYKFGIGRFDRVAVIFHDALLLRRYMQHS